MKDWRWPNFSKEEMSCSATGECEMDEIFMDALQFLRMEFGKPMVVTSAYRARTHPAEAKKKTVGTHRLGMAVDIAVSGKDALRLVQLAINQGFTGIGVNQKGPHSQRFIHLDIAPPGEGRPRPHIWSY